MEYPNETQDKLIVLYIISRLNKSITNLQMVDFVLEATGKKLIEINLSVPTREQAIEICNKWYESPSKYYLEIIKMFGSN